jgi:PhnB protein
MKINAYLNFNGECEEAFNFYAQVLDGKVSYMSSWEGSPMADHVPADWRKKIMHATLNIGDQVLMGADSMPGKHQNPQGMSVTMNLSDTAEAERIFKALAEKGTVQMALEKTFWASRFGMLVDRFGIPWMINCA